MRGWSADHNLGFHLHRIYKFRPQVSLQIQTNFNQFHKLLMFFGAFTFLLFLSKYYSPLISLNTGGGNLIFVYKTRHEISREMNIFFRGKGFAQIIVTNPTLKPNIQLFHRMNENYSFNHLLYFFSHFSLLLSFENIYNYCRRNAMFWIKVSSTLNVKDSYLGLKHFKQKEMPHQCRKEQNNFLKNLKHFFFSQPVSE